MCGTVCEPIIVVVYDTLFESFGNAVYEPIRDDVCKPIENAV